jgi:hypothetical protein
LGIAEDQMRLAEIENYFGADVTAISAGTYFRNEGITGSNPVSSTASWNELESQLAQDSDVCD